MFAQSFHYNSVGQWEPQGGKVLGKLGKANDAGEMKMDDLAKIEIASACHG